MRGLAIALILAAVLCGSSVRAELPPLCQEGRRAQDHTERLRLFNECIKAGISNARDLALAFAFRGDAYYRVGQYDLAFQDYDQAIALDSTNAMFFYGRGWTYSHYRKYDLALQDLNQALALSPGNVHALQLRGWCYYREGKYDLAMRDLDEAISRNPRLNDSFVYRGFVFDRTFNFQRAREDFAQAVALRPDNAYAIDAFADFLATCPDAAYQDGPKAVELARKACSIKDTARHLGTLATALARSGRYFEAKPVMDKAMAMAMAEKARGEFWEWLQYCRERISRNQPCTTRKYTSEQE